MFIWSVLATATGKSINSEPFSVQRPRKACNWSLRLYPDGRTAKAADYMGLFLNSHEYPHSRKTFTKVEATYKLDILNLKNKVLYSHSFAQGQGLTARTKGRGSGCGYRPPFIRRSDILKFSKDLMDDKLRVLRVGVGMELTLTTKSSGPNYKKFFKNEKLSDFKIKDANGEIIPVHKIVLSKKSRVFGAMFDTLMRERLDGHANIINIRPPVLSEMLKFIYTGKIEISYGFTKETADKCIEFIQELLAGADQYEIIPLKEMCEQFLVDNISDDNAISLLAFSGMYDCVKLEEASMERIRKNMEVLSKGKK